MSTYIHPLACVDPEAQLDDGVRVGPFAIIGAGVEIGRDTEIAGGANVQGLTRIGSENRIFPQAAIGGDPQDLKYRGEPVWLEIGDRNVFREFCTVSRGTVGGGAVTRIGSDNLFMAYAHIAHDCQVGSRTVFANLATLAGHVEVHDDATVGAFCTIQQFGRIGRHAYLGAYTATSLDALPFVKTVGVKPAVYGVNSIGLRRKGFDSGQIARLGQAVRLLTRSGLNTEQALARMRAELGDDPDVQYLIHFVETTRRGVSKTPPRGRTRGGTAPGADSDSDSDPETDGGADGIDSDAGLDAATVGAGRPGKRRSGE
jgi:UDP-N-acetylglucosamine acyltransferase